MITGLPPSCHTVVLELSLLFNLLYASTMKAYSQKQPPDILPSQAGSVLLSLRRGEFLYIDKKVSTEL